MKCLQHICKEFVFSPNAYGVTDLQADLEIQIFAGIQVVIGLMTIIHHKIMVVVIKDLEVVLDLEAVVLAL